MFVPEKWRGRLQNCRLESGGLSPAEVIAAELGGAHVYLKSIDLRFSNTTYSVRREVGMTRWLKGKLPVPEVIDAGCADGREYMVMSALSGTHIDGLRDDPHEFIARLADAVKCLQAIDTADCPFDSTLSLRLGELRDLLDGGLADTDAENWEESTEFTDPEALYAWLCENRPVEELVFSHGDLCANFFVEGDACAFYDLARAGLADKWLDIAFCVRDIRDIDTHGALEREFFELLGITPDYKKIDYYILLDELF